MISSARVNVDFGREVKVKNATIVLNGEYGRGFFDNVLRPEEAACVSRKLFKVHAIDPYAGTVTLRLLVNGRFAARNKKDEPWTVYRPSDTVKLAVNGCLRQEKAYSEAKGDYVTIADNVRFALTLVSIDSPRKSSSTPLLDFLLGSGQLQIAADGAAAASDSTYSRREKQMQYEEEKQKIRSVTGDDLIPSYRALIRLRVPFLSEVDPYVKRVMQHAENAKLEYHEKLESKGMPSECTGATRTPYTEGQIRRILPGVKSKVVKESKALHFLKVATLKHEQGMGLQLTSVQEALVQAHITEDENFSIEAFVREFPPDKRHTKVLSHSVMDHVQYVQDWNELILKKLDLYEEVRLFLAMVRGMLQEPTEPREQKADETDFEYRVYLKNFKEDSIQQGRRPFMEKEEARLKADILERKAELMQHITETFATHRLESEFYCYVNFNPDDAFKMNKFEAARCVAYDAKTGVTTFQGYHDSSLMARLVLCNRRVRFSPKYVSSQVVETSELNTRRQRLDLHMRWNKIRKEYRLKHKAVRKQCQKIRDKRRADV